MKDCGVSDMVVFFRLAHDPGHDRFGRRFFVAVFRGVSVCFFLFNGEVRLAAVLKGKLLARERRVNSVLP